MLQGALGGLATKTLAKITKAAFTRLPPNEASWIDRASSRQKPTESRKLAMGMRRLFQTPSV